MDNKLVMPMALGLSIVAVSAFVVYYIFKKEEENEECDKSQVKSSRMNVIEIQVAKSIVPALIGRSGSNIKEIQRKSGANIIFKKFSDKDYDVCIIRGRMETSQLAETLVHDFINNQPVIVEDTTLVPNWACGRIIGTGGENINDISHRSGARVRIEGSQHNDGSTTRQVTFRGTQQQIKIAKGLIENCVSQEKCRRETEQSKRSPRHATSEQTHTDSQPPGDTHASHTHKHVASKKAEVSGAAIEVYVSAVSSPSRFWVQFVGPQVAQLDELVQEMTDYYSNKDNREKHALRAAAVGQVVAGVFRADGRWYRARVAALAPNEFDPSQRVADLLFLDYGDSEFVAEHELCELRPHLLRLRFQAMECFLAGVCPRNGGSSDNRWEKWPAEAVDRFEELTQVARWKPLVSKTCSYKKSATGEGEKEKEIPGIKLYDVTDDGVIDIGEALVNEGWAEELPPSSTPIPLATPTTPFGDLGNSRVLGMLSGERAESLPRDDSASTSNPTDKTSKPSTSASDPETNKSGSSSDPVHLSYPTANPSKPQINGSHTSFLDSERLSNEQEQTVGNDPTVPSSNSKLDTANRDEFKANMNRIDSHHNLDDLTRNHKEHF